MEKKVEDLNTQLTEVSFRLKLSLANRLLIRCNWQLFALILEALGFLILFCESKIPEIKRNTHSAIRTKMGFSHVFIATKRNDLSLPSLLFRQSQQVQYFKNKKIVTILTQCLKLKK